jgi:hypothetical protein
MTDHENDVGTWKWALLAGHPGLLLNPTRLAGVLGAWRKNDLFILLVLEDGMEASLVGLHGALESLSMTPEEMVKMGQVALKLVAEKKAGG